MDLSTLNTVFVVVVLLMAISFHESAHAWMASRYGDPTAQLLGRVSLNPIRDRISCQDRWDRRATKGMSRTTGKASHGP